MRRFLATMSVLTLVVAVVGCDKSSNSGTSDDGAAPPPTEGVDGQPVAPAGSGAGGGAGMPIDG